MKLITSEFSIFLDMVSYFLIDAFTLESKEHTKEYYDRIKQSVLVCFHSWFSYKISEESV